MAKTMLMVSLCNDEGHISSQHLLGFLFGLTTVKQNYDRKNEFWNYKPASNSQWLIRLGPDTDAEC